MVNGPGAREACEGASSDEEEIPCLRRGAVGKRDGLGVGVETGEDMPLVGADRVEARTLRHGAKPLNTRTSPSLPSKSSMVAPSALPAESTNMSLPSSPTKVFAPIDTRVL